MNVKELENKRIAVLLSGGVDSSVVVYELARLGLQPDCFYIKIGASPNPSEGGENLPQPLRRRGEPALSSDAGKRRLLIAPTLTEDEAEWDCSMEEDMEMATAVAHKYGCRLEVVDCHREYWDQVTKYTMDKVRAGLTPNPDVMCNRLIKFGAFHEKRGHDYDVIATGHYAQTEVDDSSQFTVHSSQFFAEQSGKAERTVHSSQLAVGSSQPKAIKWLCTSPDPVKDQTDFLAQLYGWQLEKALFPIGHYVKDEVRQIAEREHLVSAHRKDSQGICFLGKIDYTEYIRRYLGEQPGDVIELETGRRIGEHRGHWFYTIGQRKGLGFGGGPWFIVKKDVENNALYVAHGYDPTTVYKKDFDVHAFHSINGVMPPEDITFKIRHTPEYHPARLEPLGDGRYTVHSSQPIHGVAPGQFCVVYDAQHHRCYGSAEICL